MSLPESVVIVGGGVAGFTTAQELRRLDFAGSVAIVDPQGTPYDRPPLSKDYLAGSLDAEGLGLAPSGWFAEHRVDVVADRVVELDAQGPAVRLASGGELRADAVVLATGGRPRTLPVPGADDPGLLVLRTRADADRLRTALTPGRRLAIVGAGLIGAEVTSVARGLGADVTLIDPVPLPGVALFGPVIAAELQAQHADHGVRVVAGQVGAIERLGTNWRLRIAGSAVPATAAPATAGLRPATAEIEADAVLLAIGIEPDLALATASGLAVDRGVLVDAAQRTSHPAVYAVGDGAQPRLPDGTPGARHEHWDSAVQDARRAAAALTGTEPPAATAPWLWSDRYGVHVEVVGTMRGDGPTVVRAVDGRPRLEFRLDAAGRLAGASGIDPGTAIRAARRIIDRGRELDPAQLADPAVDLQKLAR